MKRFRSSVGLSIALSVLAAAYGRAEWADPMDMMMSPSNSNTGSGSTGVDPMSMTMTPPDSNTGFGSTGADPMSSMSSMPSMPTPLPVISGTSGPGPLIQPRMEVIPGGDGIMMHFQGDMQRIRMIIADIDRRRVAGTANASQVVSDMTQAVLVPLLHILQTDSKWEIPGFYETIRVEFRNALAVVQAAIADADRINQVVHPPTLQTFVARTADITRELDGKEDRPLTPPTTRPPSPFLTY